MSEKIEYFFKGGNGNIIRSKQEWPYSEIGCVEKILDKTLKRGGKKLGGTYLTNLMHPRTEEIGKRVCKILYDRSVIGINDVTPETNPSSITYYRTVLKTYVDYFKVRVPMTLIRDSGESIGIKHKDIDTEMVITFSDKFEDCDPHMSSYISERPASKPRKKVEKQNYLKTQTRKFFINAFNNYFNTDLKHKDFSRKFNMDVFAEYDFASGTELESKRIFGQASPLLEELLEVKRGLSNDPHTFFRTDEFIEMIVDYVGKNL